MTKEEKERKYLINIFTKHLEINIAIMEYSKSITNDPKSKRVCNDSIRKSKKAIERLPHIKHVAILKALYRSLVNGKEVLYSMCGPLIIGKQTTFWDTEKGYVEFLKADEIAMKEATEKAEKRKKDREIIKKAKEEGKKIEFALIDGKLKPVIVEDSGENPN